MKKILLTVSIVILYVSLVKAGMNKVHDTRVFLITLDGLRWQELFSGADKLLIARKGIVADSVYLKKLFWRNTPKKRRKALMPFLWKQAIKKGVFYGNRNLGSKVNLTNKMWFSYPGYNEILTGKADDKLIKSNNKIYNHNKTILELANNTKSYKGRVAAFGSWDVFPYIINNKRSGVPVNAGFDIAKGNDLTSNELFLNKLQPTIPSPWASVRLDAFTHNYALEYIKRKHPKFIYIAYGETDDFAHDGNYQAYLKSAHTTDRMIKELWEFTQNDTFYKGKTVFVISTDHGRGTGITPKTTWRHHNVNIKKSDQVWIIVFGNGVKRVGEVSCDEQIYSNQIAPTILKLLNININKKDMKGKPLKVLK